MFGLSLGHLLILSVVVLLFGSRRLPELGTAIGKGVQLLKKACQEKRTYRLRIYKCLKKVFVIRMQYCLPIKINPNAIPLAESAFYAHGL